MEGSGRGRSAEKERAPRTNTVRWKVIGNEIIKNVGKYQSCMVSKLPIIFKRTRTTEG